MLNYVLTKAFHCSQFVNCMIIYCDTAGEKFPGDLLSYFERHRTEVGILSLFSAERKFPTARTQQEKWMQTKLLLLATHLSSASGISRAETMICRNFLQIHLQRGPIIQEIPIYLVGTKHKYCRCFEA